MLLTILPLPLHDYGIRAGKAKLFTFSYIVTLDRGGGAMWLRRWVGLLSVVVLLWCCPGARWPGRASATTGNTAAAVVPAHYKVPRKVAVLYPGQYVLQSAAGGSRLIHGQLEFEINSLGYLQGIGSFMSYDNQGYQTSWVATFYNFHLTAPGTMTIEIFDVTGTHVFGHLYLQRTKQGDLRGQIALPKTRYAIAFQRRVAL